MPHHALKHDGLAETRPESVMLSSQMIALINHLSAVIGVAGGGAWTVRASAKHVCWLIVVLVVLFKTEKTSLADVLKELPKQ